MVSSTPLTHLCGLFYWIGITETATYYVSLTRQEINFPVHQAQWWVHPKIHQIASQVSVSEQYLSDG